MWFGVLYLDCLVVGYGSGILPWVAGGRVMGPISSDVEGSLRILADNLAPYFKRWSAEAKILF